MSVNDTIAPIGVLDVQKDVVTKDPPMAIETISILDNSGQTNVADGAHTTVNGTNESITPRTEPVVMIAPADSGTSDVNATLLPHDSSTPNNDTSSNNTPSESKPTEVSDVTIEVAEPNVVAEKRVVFEEPIASSSTDSPPSSVVAGDQASVAAPSNFAAQTTPVKPLSRSNENVFNESRAPLTTSTSTPSIPTTTNEHSDATTTTTPSSSSNAVQAGNSTPPHQAVNNLLPKSELRTSARNLRNSILGIDPVGEEEYDEHGAKVRKMKRKERSHSKIVLHHKKNLIGETIFKGHQSWVLMMNIQTGIRNAVGRGHSRSTITAPKSPLVIAGSPAGSNPSPASSAPKSPVEFPSPHNFDNIEEFYASPKVLNFPPEGSANTIPHTTGPFKFKDYCPHAFRFLRHRFGIDTADYMVSLCNTQKNGENALRELPTPGKSGSLFFFSHDMRFILKTIPKSEAKLLRSLLPSYVEHIANDENTLLPKFFGLHRVKPHKGRQVRFLVMSNVFQTRKTIHERYDLKGSTLGRQASEEEKKKDSVTYKDLDFRERHMKVQIGPQKRNALLEQLQRDVKFLAKLNIMDYSLLIGVHNIEKDDDYSGYISDPPSPQTSRSSKKSQALNLSHEYFHSIFQINDGGLQGIDEGVPNNKFYYIGIIDILMLYSLRKKVEHTYKTLRYGKAEEISSISPNEYATRFYEFMAASIT